MKNKTPVHLGFTLIELLMVIAIIGVLASIVLASLSSARTKSYDSKIKAQMTSLRTAMNLYYNNTGDFGVSSAIDGCNTAPSVAPWNDSGTGLLVLSDEDNYPQGNALTCYTSGQAWAAEAILGKGSGNHYCIDSVGTIKNQAGIILTPAGDVTC